MALKAGYVGVKRWLYEKLQATTAKNVQDIVDIWSTNNITGVHNIFSVPTGYTAKSGSSVSYADAVYTITTDTTNDAGMYFSAGATLRPSLAAFAGVKGKLSFEYKAEAAFNGVVGFDTAVKYSTNYVKYEADIADLSQISAIVFYDRDTTAGHTISVKNLMIRLATDPNTVYVPYAKTNQQLTADIATDATTLNNHKTTINGIISAATGAADFTAFKTAMAALTPLTRSAALDTREVSPEVIEEPETVTKTTRKSTKKEDN